jgi:predicted alpha/beta-fold hydrolase
LSDDVGAVAEWLAREEGVKEVHLAGFSMGGNQVLKLAGERRRRARRTSRASWQVCPALELRRCAAALERRENRLYQWNHSRAAGAAAARRGSSQPISC